MSGKGWGKDSSSDEEKNGIPRKKGIPGMPVPGRALYIHDMKEPKKNNPPSKVKLISTPNPEYNPNKVVYGRTYDESPSMYLFNLKEVSSGSEDNKNNNKNNNNNNNNNKQSFKMPPLVNRSNTPSYYSYESGDESRITHDSEFTNNMFTTGRSSAPNYSRSTSTTSLRETKSDPQTTQSKHNNYQQTWEPTSSDEEDNHKNSYRYGNRR